MSQFSLRITSNPKRTFAVLVGVVSAALVIIIGYHFYDWHTTVAANEQGYQQGREAVNRLLSDEAPARGTVAETVVQLDRQISELCNQQAFLAGARSALFETAASELSQCDERKRKLVRVRDAAHDINQYLKQDEEIAQAFSDAAKKLSEVEAGDFASQRKVYETLQAMLADMMNDAEPSVSTFKEQQKVVKKLISAYNEVIQADKEQNRTEFDIALIELEKAHKELSVTANDAAANYDAKLQKLLDSVQAL